MGSFTEKCMKFSLFEENIIICTEYELNVANFKGIIKHNQKFTESEGKLLGIDVMHNFLIMWTKNNYIRIFDLSRREPK